jgi:hypothetical protein
MHGDVEFPPQLAWLSYLAGQASSVWSATETGMRLIAEHLGTAAAALEELISPLARARANTEAALVGEMAAAVQLQFALLFDGPYSMGTLVDAVRALGDLAANLSELIQYAKLQVIATLAIAAASISWALANAALTSGASLVEAAAAEETAILTINKLVAEVAGRIVEALAATLTKTTVSRLLAETLGSALMGAGQEAAVEMAQGLLGGRGGINWGKVLDATGSMAAGGGAAGLVGHLVSGVLGPAKNLLEQMGKGALTGLSSAEAANVAGTLAGGAPPTWMTVWGGLIGLGHGAVPGGGHATAGHEPAEGVVAADRPPAPAPVERLAGEPGAAGDVAVNVTDVGSAAHPATAAGGVAVDAGHGDPLGVPADSGTELPETAAAPRLQSPALAGGATEMDRAAQAGRLETQSHVPSRAEDVPGSGARGGLRLVPGRTDESAARGDSALATPDQRGRLHVVTGDLGHLAAEDSAHPQGAAGAGAGGRGFMRHSAVPGDPLADVEDLDLVAGRDGGGVALLERGSDQHDGVPAGSDAGGDAVESVSPLENCAVAVWKDTSAAFEREYPFKDRLRDWVSQQRHGSKYSKDYLESVEEYLNGGSVPKEGLSAKPLYQAHNSAAHFTTSDTVAHPPAGKPGGWRRAIVAVKWAEGGPREGGHIFELEKEENGEVFFLDPQAQERVPWPPSWWTDGLVARRDDGTPLMVAGYLDHNGDALVRLDQAPERAAAAEDVDNIALHRPVTEDPGAIDTTAGHLDEGLPSPVVEPYGPAEGSHGPEDSVEDSGVRRYADALVRQGSIDPRELTKRIELAGQASSGEDPHPRVIDARAQEAAARTQLLKSVATHEAAVHERDTELAACREGRVPADERMARAHQELEHSRAQLAQRRVAVESATTERERLLSEAAAGSDPESHVAHQQRLAALEERVGAAEAERAAGEATVAAAQAHYDSQVQTVIEERTAQLEDAVGSAQERMNRAGEAFDSAVAADDAALRDAVEQRYTELRAQAREEIAAEEAHAEQVWAQSGDRMRELGEGVTAAHTTWEGAQRAHKQAVDELEAAVGGEWDARIADAQQGVAAELEGLREIRRAYAEESSGSEPRQQRLKQLGADFAEGRKRLRPQMIRREALLRAAPGDHDAELEAARAEWAEWSELGAPGPRESVLGSPLRWLDRARSEFEVTQRIRDLEAPVARESKAKVQAREAELKAATEAYAGARREFESAGQELVEQRLQVLRTAGAADLAAYDAGLADRTALEDAARKREAAAAAAEETAAAYDQVVWRAPQDSVAVRRSDAQVWDRMVNGTTIERITTMPEWVRRATGMDPRETQWQGWMLAAADMKTGEGKTLVASMRIVLDLLEYGRVHAWTSSDHLVSEMIDAVNTLTRSPIGELPVDTYRMGDEGALPQLREGRSQFFADTKQNYKFRALRAMRSMLDHIAEAAVPTEVGVPPEEIAARRAQFIAPLREQINARPPIDDIKRLLDGAAAKYGLDERFDPFPPGRHIVDEIDSLFDGEEAVLSPGGNEDAPEEEVALLRQVLDRVNAAEKLGLDAAHFGRPENTMGMWDATLTGEAVGLLNRVPGDPVSVDDPNAKLYTDAALAKWGRRRNSDWIEARGGDPQGAGQVGLIASDTNDKLQTNREELTSTRLQGVGKFLDLLAGVPVKADLPEESLYLSDDQLIGSSLLLDTGGWSGTAEVVAGEFYDRYGILISKVEPYYRSKLREEAPPRMFDSEQAKRKGMASDILDDGQLELVVRDGQVVGVRLTGRPQWVESFDNGPIRGDDIRVVDGKEPIRLTGWRDKEDHEKGHVDWLDQLTDERGHAMAAERGLRVADGVELKLDYTVRDARWWDEHGNGVAAEQLAKQQTRQWGDPGSLHFGHKGDTRGVDPTPTPESIKLGGTAVKMDGGPEYGDRAVEQGEGRAARGGEGEDREEGGTPGGYKMYLSPENLRTRVANDGVVRQVIQFTEAVKARDAAQTPAERDQAQREVAAAERVLREQTAPRVQRLAEEHLLTRARGRASLTHPPPVGHTTSAVPPGRTTAAAEADRGSVEQMATPLAGAAEQLAFAQQHFAQRGVSTPITLSDTSILTATQFADVFSRDTLTPAVPLQSAPPGDGWHRADTADLVARLLDDTDPTDLAFLLTTSPAGSEEPGNVWTLTTSEDGQLLLHEVVAAATDTDSDAAQEYDHLCANEADVRACIRLQPGTRLHAIIADRDGAIIAQPPVETAVLATAGSAPARGAAVHTRARANTAVRGSFGRRGPGVPSSDRARLKDEIEAIRREIASLGSSSKDREAQGDAQHEARLHSLRARIERVATEHAGLLARGVDVLSLPMYSPGAGGPVELNDREAEQAQNAVYVLGDPDPDWRSAKYALYRAVQGMAPLDAVEVARFEAAERLGVAEPHLLDPAELTAILARATGAQRADVDGNGSVAGRDDGAGSDGGEGRGDRGSDRGVPVGLGVDPAVVAVANQALAQRVPSVRADVLVHPLDDRVAVVARARANAVWWKGLRDDQRWALIQAYPRQIGQLDGIPARETDGVPGRHEANSELLQRYLAVRDELVARRDKGIALNRRQVDYIERINGIEAALREAEQWAQQAGVGGPYLWVFDPSAFDGAGRVLVWFSHDPDGEHRLYRAKSVSWLVPGMGTTIRKLPVVMRSALNQLESVRREAPGLPAASFAWIGYQAPGMGDPRVAGLGMARVGGQNLYNDIVAFNAYYDACVADGSHFNGNHLFGHSYGSTTLGFAGQGGRLRTEMRTVTLVGSPGAGPIQHASEFDIGDNVFVASSSRDPVTGLGGRRPGEMGRFFGHGLGMDPAMDFWGGRRVTSEFPAESDHIGRGSLFTHSLYWSYADDRAHPPVRSESLANFGRIAAGHPERVDLEAHRTLVRTGWRRERTVEPAAARRLLRLVDDPDTAHPTGKRHWFNPRWHTDSTGEPSLGGGRVDLRDAERVGSEDLAAIAEDALSQRVPRVGADELVRPLGDAELAVQRVQANVAWSKRLSEDQLVALVKTYPEQIGKAEGMPDWARYAANSLVMENYLAARDELKSRRDKGETLSDAESEYIRRADYVEAQWRRAVEEARAAGVDGPYLLEFDPSEFNGAGRIIVVFSKNCASLYEAKSVSWEEPGAGFTLDQIGPLLGYALNQLDSVLREEPTMPAVSMARLDYPTMPDDLDDPYAFLRAPYAYLRAARIGGEILYSDIRGFNAAHDAWAGDRRRRFKGNHLYGHCQGSAVVGYAGQGQRLDPEIRTVTLVGSMGAGPITHASEFGPNVKVYVATSSIDSRTLRAGTPQGTGADPAMDYFGGIRVTAEFLLKRMPRGFSIHNGYWAFVGKATRGTRTQSLANFGRSGSEHYERVEVEDHRIIVKKPGLGLRMFDPVLERSKALADFTPPGSRANRGAEAPRPHQNCAFGVRDELSRMYPGRGYRRIKGWWTRRGVRARALFEAVGSGAEFTTYAEVVARLRDLGWGSSAVLASAWKVGSGGHAYLAKNDRGDIKFFDPHTGEWSEGLRWAEDQVSKTVVGYLDADGNALDELRDPAAQLAHANKIGFVRGRWDPSDGANDPVRVLGVEDLIRMLDLDDLIRMLFLDDDSGGTLSEDAAAEVYTEGERRLRGLNERLTGERVSAEQRASLLFDLRRLLGAWTRNLMSDRTAADGLAGLESNEIFQDLIETLQAWGLAGDEVYDTIIYAATRIHHGVGSLSDMSDTALSDIQIRTVYADREREMRDHAQQLSKDGSSTKEIAEIIYDRQRDLRIWTIAALMSNRLLVEVSTEPEGYPTLEQLFERNLALGLDPEAAYQAIIDPEFLGQAPPQPKNCLLACNDKLNEWYGWWQVSHVKAQPTRKGIPAVEGFKARNSAADFVETFDEVRDGFKDLPVGSSAMVAVKWKWSAWAKFVEWFKGRDGGHMFLARKVSEDEIHWVDPKTDREGPWPPPWLQKEVERMAVGYFYDTGKAVKPLNVPPADTAGHPGSDQVDPEFVRQREAYEDPLDPRLAAAHHIGEVAGEKEQGPDEPFELDLGGDRPALAVWVADIAKLRSFLAALGLDAPQPTVVVIGGAVELDNTKMKHLRDQVDAIVRVVQKRGAVVVDGGTLFGVMQLMGEAHRDLEATFPLVGVVPAGWVELPGRPRPPPERDPWTLEPNHTHFVAVLESEPGAEVGDAATVLAGAGAKPSVTVVINGGEATLLEAEQSVKAGRPIIVVAGSGRIADAIVGIPADVSEDQRQRARVVAASGLVHLVPMDEPEVLADLLTAFLDGRIVGGGSDRWDSSIENVLAGPAEKLHLPDEGDDRGSRDTRGTATGGENLRRVEEGERWLRGSKGIAGRIPGQVADALRRREFKNFDDFREEFWKEICRHKELLSQFSSANHARMANGNSPFAAQSQWYRRSTVYHLHHMDPIHNGGGVYDLDNIVVVTPRYHAEILYPKFHYNQ